MRKVKILHTADWHLGKIVHGVHMTEDQQYILDQLIEIIKKEKPDCIIIAGDLYDRSVPPKEAVELLNHTLTEICTKLNIPTLAIAGNHDSPDRLGFGASLFRSQQLYLHTTIEQAFDPIILSDEYGEIHFYLLPYLEPSNVRDYFQDDDILTHQHAMTRIIEQIKQSWNPLVRNILVGHAFVAGGLESESEERLTMIGGSPYVDANLFQDFDYVALGHLHQQQKIYRDTVRYSGSVLKYSFSEANHKKSITFVQINGKNDCIIARHELKPIRDLKVVKGYFQELIEEKILTSTKDYLHIELLDDGEILDPVSKLRTIFPNILRLNRSNHMLGQTIKDRESIQKRQEMNHEQLFELFYEEIKGEQIPEQRKKYVHNVIEELLLDERKN
jgi:DNA repair protein SbcD/Mre11